MKVLFVSLQILMVMSTWYLDTGIQALSTLSHLHEHHHETHEPHKEISSSHDHAEVVSLTHTHSHEETAKTPTNDETHEHRVPVSHSNSTFYISYVDYQLPEVTQLNFVPDVEEDFLISSHYIQGVFRPPIA